MIAMLQVFVTSTKYTGGFTSAAGADTQCQERANTVLKYGTWKAWMSDSTRHAKDALPANGTWQRLDGTLVGSHAQISGSTLLAPINVNKYLAVASGLLLAWTGTGAAGMAVGNYCDNWKSTSLNGRAAGDLTLTNCQWTYKSNHNCGGDARSRVWPATDRTNGVAWGVGGQLARRTPAASTEPHDDIPKASRHPPGG